MPVRGLRKCGVCVRATLWRDYRPQFEGCDVTSWLANQVLMTVKAHGNSGHGIHESSGSRNCIFLFNWRFVSTRKWLWRCFMWFVRFTTSFHEYQWFNTSIHKKSLGHACILKCICIYQNFLYIIDYNSVLCTLILINKCNIQIGTIYERNTCFLTNDKIFYTLHGDKCILGHSFTDSISHISNFNLLTNLYCNIMASVPAVHYLSKNLFYTIPTSILGMIHNRYSKISNLHEEEQTVIYLSLYIFVE